MTMTSIRRRNSLQSTLLCRRNGALYWTMMLGLILLLTTQQVTMGQTPAPVAVAASGTLTPSTGTSGQGTQTPVLTSAPSPVAPTAPSTSSPVVPSSTSGTPTVAPAVGSGSPVTEAPGTGTPASPVTKSPSTGTASPSTAVPGTAIPGTAIPGTAAPDTPAPSVTQTQKATESPTVAPVLTAPPSASATTAAPSAATPKPSPGPTASTGSPTAASPPPTPSPSTAPVTSDPTVKPSLGATPYPTDKATKSPSIAPTEHPSHSPSEKPTHVGSTNKPTLPTHMPSTFPSQAPSLLTDAFFKNLNMTLYGLSSFAGGAQSSWTSTTESYIESYFKTRPGLQVNVNHVILTIQSSEVIFSNGGRRRSTRGLQSGTPSVVVTYNQEFGFKSPDTNFNPEYVVTQPFVGDTTAYRKILAQSNPTAFNGLSGVSQVEVSGNPNNIAGSNNKSSGLSKLAIIIIGAGAGVLGLALLVALCYYMSSQRGRRMRRGYMAKKDNDDSPPTQLQLGTGADEVSTLAEPLPQTKMGRGGGHESIAGYGDQSVTTVDYDYSKAYGGAGDTSVSSAGGTFGSNTQQNVEVTAAAAAAGAALGSSFSDGDSFDANYRESGANFKEELIDIYAPPGKLGVVIDTPDDGAPVVHAIKDSSVICDKLQVGDKLVAVDDEDVRSMTAIKVSKLISRKSANPTRKLSILRTTIVE